MKKHLIFILLALASGFGGAYLYDITLNQEPRHIEYRDNPTSFSGQPTDYTPLLADNLPDDFTVASMNSTPSVVYVRTITPSRYASSWMDWFFGEGASSQISTGSGVIYRSDGYIITNNHVIDGATEIEVIIEKQTYTAELIGADPSTDIALLRIDERNLPAIPLGSSADVRVGQWVLAVGNPFNLTSTVTAGIVSAKGRQINVLKDKFPIESFIQTDAAINPGNSGGALVNMQGELVGVNTAILSRTGSYAGYGFAVPVDIVRKVVDDIIRYGEVQKAFIGAEVVDINSDLAERLDLESLEGVVVSLIQENGAAARAGIERGDVLLAIDDSPIDSKSKFEEILSYKSPGDKISVKFRHNGTLREKTLTLTNLDGGTGIITREIFSSKSLGADFERVPRMELEYLGVSNGVRIKEVRSGFIRRMSLPEGFIVTHINRTPIESPEELEEILERIRGRVIVEGLDKNGNRDYYRYYF